MAKKPKKPWTDRDPVWDQIANPGDCRKHMTKGGNCRFCRPAASKKSRRSK